MITSAVYLARFIIGIIGNVISAGLFLSPILTFYKIYKAKSVEGFKIDPYLVTILNCAMWSFYGMPFINKNDILVLTINGAGFLLQLSYITIYFLFSRSWPKRKKILLFLLVEIIFFTAVVLITLVVLPTSKRVLFLGIIAIIFNIGMYAAPLTIMKTVIKTKSVKYMPFFLSAASFSNGIIWTIYALLDFDPFLFVPNCLGAILGTLQLVLYAWYHGNKNSDQEIAKPSVELAASVA